MIKKPRLVPKELKMSWSLHARANLMGDEKWRIEKGLAGEVKFDSLTDELLHKKCHIINGLWLKSGDSAFQIDKIMIFQKIIHLIDVKNYEGDYHYDAKGRLIKTDKFMSDPLSQLKRADTLFRQILQENNIQFDIISYLVFVNPEFTLYAPQNESIILPTQVNRFLKKLNNEYSWLNEGHERLAELLVSLDLVDSPYATFPAYEFGSLKKGLLCCKCHRLSTFVRGDKLVCGDCGAEEPLDDAVLRGVRELVMLFPGMKITTSLVYEWFGGILPKRTIRRILKKNFQLVRKSKYSYYLVN